MKTGITAPKGFEACGVAAGIRNKKDKLDMALVYSTVPCVCAGTFTRNKVKAAPVLWDQHVVSGGRAQAVVINSGIANACTGKEGMDKCELTAQLLGEKLNIVKDQVLVCSTGVIGMQLDMNKIENGISLLVEAKTDSEEDGIKAAEAILTTDTHKKVISEQCVINGKNVTIGGMCKGSGMIHPNMGTMLAFVTSDVAIAPGTLKAMVKDIVEDTFNMVSVDGDTSTNDTCLVLCNGLAGNEVIDESHPDYEIFKQALFHVLAYLSKQIAGDGEGCTRLFEVTCKGAATKEDAKIISKSVVCSSLTKAAVYGKDANWGRILCAMGYSGGDFDPEKVDIVLESEYGSLEIVKDGVATDYSEEKATEILSANPVKAILELHQGDDSARAWGCDLTYEYVRINADYRS